MPVVMNLYEANLPELVAAAERGEEAIITRRAVPVALVTAVTGMRRRPMGIYPLRYTDDEAAFAMQPAFTEAELKEWGLS